jgi:hypothetical protein
MQWPPSGQRHRPLVVTFSNQSNQMNVFSWSIRCCAKYSEPCTPPLLLVPGQYRRARNPLFYFGKVHSLLKNLVLQSLESKRTFKLFNASHGFLKFRSWDNGFIGTDCDQRTFQISFAPLKQLSCSQSMLAGYQRNRASWFIGLFDDFKLLLRSPAPAALNTGDHFHPIRSY